MRTFIAINISVEEGLKFLINQLKADLVANTIKWVNISSLHLTLFYLGETSQKQIDEIRKTLRDQLSNFLAFHITLRGIGVFGTKGNPKIIWVGVNPSCCLKEAYKLVNDCIAPIGFSPDPRPFNPHITIGRVKGALNHILLEKLLIEKSSMEVQRCIVDRVILYKSDLDSMGPIYTPLFYQNLRLEQS